MTRWHLLDRVHRGFWDEGEETATATASEIGTTFTADTRFDGLILADEHTSTFAYSQILDAFLSASAATTATHTFGIGFDGRLSAAEVLFTFNDVATFDGLIQGQQTLKIQVLDTVLVSAATTLKSVSLDSNLSASFTRTTSTISLDGPLLKTATKTTGLDASTLKALQHTNIQQFNAILIQQVTRSQLFDGVLFKIATTFQASAVLDAALLTTTIPLVHLDGLLQSTIPATGADAVLVPEVISGTIRTKTPSLDAVLQQGTPTTTGADAILGHRSSFFFFN